MTDDATLTHDPLDTTDTVAPDVAFDLTDGEDAEEEEAVRAEPRAMAHEAPGRGAELRQQVIRVEGAAGFGAGIGRRRAWELRRARR